MRFSDILKLQPPEPGQGRVPQTSAPSPAAERPIQAPLRQVKSPQDPDLKDKLDKIESELLRLSGQKAKESEEQLREKDKNFEEERRKLDQRIRELQAANEKLMLDIGKNVEEEIEKRLAKERDKLSQDMSAAAARLEMLEKQITQRNLELSEKEHAIEQEMRRHAEAQRLKQEEAARNAEKAKEKPAAPAENGIPPAAIQENWDQKLSALPPKLRAAETPAKVPVRTPDLRHDMPLMSSSPETMLSAVLDPEIEKKAKQVYREIMTQAERIFEDVRKKKEPDLSPLAETFDKLADLAALHDAELINMVLEPYPETNYFPYHGVNCSVLSIILGADFNLTQAQLKELATASLLHDIGLVMIEETLNYPKLPTPEIQSQILRHPEHGAEILAGKVSDAILTAIRQHHETEDGKGYPNALQGDDIHLFAKILQCVDSFEAMTHRRPYRKKPMDANIALKEMIDKGRGVYDRGVLKALMGRVGLFPVMSLVELSNKQIARVIKQNRLFPMSPVVRIEFDEDGGKIKNTPVLDLTKNQLVHVIGLVGSMPSFQHQRSEEARLPSKKKKNEPTDFRFTDIIAFLLVSIVLILLVYLAIKI